METTIIIPQKNDSQLLEHQVSELCRVFDALPGDYEILIVDAGSSSTDRARVSTLCASEDTVRAIGLLSDSGLSTAINAGLQHARGERIFVTEAGQRFPVQQAELLLSRLVRADMVVGRPARKFWSKLLHRCVRIPRWFMLGLEVRDPECLFWAVRREAVQRIELSRGMYRYVSSLVTARGYRVIEQAITMHDRAKQPHLKDGWPNPFDLFVAWWLKRRATVCSAAPLSESSDDQSTTWPDILRMPTTDTESSTWRRSA